MCHPLMCALASKAISLLGGIDKFHRLVKSSGGKYLLWKMPMEMEMFQMIYSYM
jgi:hypothetical protein